MRSKTWILAVVAGFVSLLGGAIGWSSAQTEVLPVGDTVTVSFDGTKLAVDNTWAVVDRDADMKWVRKAGQTFEFEAVFPENNPFNTEVGRKFKSENLDEKAKLHGMKHKVLKTTAPGRYHYILVATINGQTYVLDPEIIVPRPGKG